MRKSLDSIVKPSFAPSLDHGARLTYRERWQYQVAQSAAQLSRSAFRSLVKMLKPFGRLVLISKFSLVIVLIGMVVSLSAFEAHVLNVTATIEKRPCTEIGFDFDPHGALILPGQRIDNEYQTFGLLIFGENSVAPVENRAITFDSVSPTGGDIDLGAPNEDFGGPGVGVGGGQGEPGENSRTQNNLLIIAEDMTDATNDGLIDVPSDEEQGGELIFTFVDETSVDHIRLIDIEDAGVTIELFDGANNNFHTTHVPALGNNSSQKVLLNATGVKKMVVGFIGSGAADDVCFDPVEAPPICDARSPGYFANHEGCSQGTGSSVWTNEINNLSNMFFGVFGSYSGEQICQNLWQPNCRSGNSTQRRLCRSKRHTLADELNVASGHLHLDALLVGADDGSSAFDALGLTSTSTVRQALAMIEGVLASSSSTRRQIANAGHVAGRIYTFYEEENPDAPACIFTPPPPDECDDDDDPHSSSGDRDRCKDDSDHEVGGSRRGRGRERHFDLPAIEQMLEESAAEEETLAPDTFSPTAESSPAIDETIVSASSSDALQETTSTTASSTTEGTTSQGGETPETLETSTTLEAATETPQPDSPSQAPQEATSTGGTPGVKGEVQTQEATNVDNFLSANAPAHPEAAAGLDSSE